MKIGLFIKYEVVPQNFEKEMIDKIIGHGHLFDNENPDYVFVFGGDGTFLKSVQKYLDRINDIKFVCFNKGKLAYFSDFNEDEVDYVLSLLDKDEFLISSHSLLCAKMKDETLYGLNEIRIENPFRTLMSEVYVDDTYLETFRGNGLVVCTSLGSSAYNKSLSGACVSTYLEVMQLNEIAPINNCLYSSLRSPLILPKGSSITFKGEFKDVVIGYDNQIKKDSHSNEINFFLSEKKVNLVFKKNHNYIDKLSKSFVSRR